MPLPICQFAMHVLQATFALKNVMGERSSTLQTLKLKRRVDKHVSKRSYGREPMMHEGS